MATGKANLPIYQGDDYAVDCIVTAEDGVTPADLTGYVAHSHIRASLSDALVAEFKTFIKGNVVTLMLEHDITVTLTDNAYLWDLQLTSERGWVTTVLAGQVIVAKDVTKVYQPQRASA